MTYVAFHNSCEYKMSFLLGYMDKELFREWFFNLFLKHCGSDRPIILLMDNHDSHFSLEVLERAIEERVRKSSDNSSSKHPF